MKADCIVVGGGVIGMMCARWLAKAGMSVTLYDRQKTGRESSWAGGGILSPLYPWREEEALLTLSLWSQKHYPHLVQELYEESGIDSEWLPSGLLFLEEHEIEANHQWCLKRGYVSRKVSGTELKSHVPNLSLATEAALWLPEIAQVRNSRLVKALRGSLVNWGVKITEDQEVQSILTERGRAIGVQSRRDRAYAARILIAAGAWTGPLLEKTGIRLPIVPVRGQILLFRAPLNFLNTMLLHRGFYLIPRRDGLILTGSTVETAGFDKHTTQEALESLKHRAVELMADFRHFEVIQQWAGLRPGSPRGIPMIGEHPLLKGLYIAAGHFRNGINTAPATAQLVSDLLGENIPQVDPEPYQFEKFV